jgi:hypothetical protein
MTPTIDQNTPSRNCHNCGAMMFFTNQCPKCGVTRIEGAEFERKPEFATDTERRLYQELQALRGELVDLSVVSTPKLLAELDRRQYSIMEKGLLDDGENLRVLADVNQNPTSTVVSTEAPKPIQPPVQGKPKKA